MTQRSCGECMFFVLAAKGAMSGNCHRNSPKPYIGESHDTNWPTVFVDDWCGEFSNGDIADSSKSTCDDPGCLDCAAHGKVAAELSKSPLDPGVALAIGLEFAADGIERAVGLKDQILRIEVKEELFARLFAPTESLKYRGGITPCVVMVNGFDVMVTALRKVPPGGRPAREVREP